MILHLVGSFLLSFLPMLAGLVWTMARLTRRDRDMRWIVADFVRPGESRAPSSLAD